MFGSCGGYNSGAGGGGGGIHSGLRLRAFVSNPVFPTSTGSGSPVLDILDASLDHISGFAVPLTGFTANLASAGKMAVAPNRARTLVFSPTDSKLGVVDNQQETLATVIPLPGSSESFFFGTDSVSAFAAIPSAPVTGQSPGVVERLDTSAGAVTATIPVPGAHFLVQSPNGNQILVFSDNSNTVVLITPSLIGAGAQPSTVTSCTTTPVAACIIPATFDHPISAEFDASGSTAYVINCGPECGGQAAGVSVVNVAGIQSGSNIILGTVPVPAATVGLLQGGVLYVAGTQPGTGGILSVLNFASAGPSGINCSSQPATNCQLFSITDGFHTGMQMGANGQLFVGARNCSSGCLSILNTVTANVVLPTDIGDVTGMAPIPNRSVFYVCEGGQLHVYDTTTDQLENIPQPYGQPNIIGQAVDVAVVDF